MKTSETNVSLNDGETIHVQIFEADVTPSAPRDILLLHGWPNNGRIWSLFAESMILADPRFRLFAPTFRGYGLSSAATEGYTTSGFADDILVVVSRLHLNQFGIIGHSMGGKIAQAIAVRRPEGLKSLVLLAPATAAASQTPPEKRADQKSLHGDPAKMLDLLTGMSASPIREPALSSLIQDALQVTPLAFASWIEPMREEDFATDLATIGVPTLVLLGAKDPLRTEAGQRQGVVDPIPNAALSLLPNVGHLPHVEDPIILAMAVVNFLDHSKPAETA